MYESNTRSESYFTKAEEVENLKKEIAELRRALAERGSSIIEPIQLGNSVDAVYLSSANSEVALEVFCSTEGGWFAELCDGSETHTFSLRPRYPECVTVGMYVQHTLTHSIELEVEFNSREDYEDYMKDPQLYIEANHELDVAYECVSEMIDSNIDSVDMDTVEVSGIRTLEKLY